MKKRENNESKRPRQPNNYLQLIGVATQMGVTIFLGAYFGKWLDGKYPMEKRWFTIGLTLLSVAIALYNVLRQVNRINNQNKDGQKD